jgi:hypothetical protein
MAIDKRYETDFLYFDEGPHKYTDTLGNEYRSVTTLIGDYYNHFDADYWAHKKAREQGKSEKAIKAEWEKIKDEACTRGTATHNGIEDAIKDVSKFKNAIKYLENTDSGRCVTIADIPKLIPQPLDVEKFKEATDNKYPEIYRVFDYYTSKGYVIYSEIGMFLIDYLISGTIDIFCYRPTDFVILDWKTNRDGLKFEAGYYKKDKTTVPNQLTDIWVKKRSNMLPPLSHLEDCNGEHYAMQLSLYALGAELILGIPCHGLGLCHIGSPWIKNKYGQPYRDKDGYHVDPNGKETVNWFRINYHKKEALDLLQDRYYKLKADNKLSNKELSLF